MQSSTRQFKIKHIISLIIAMMIIAMIPNEAFAAESDTDPFASATPEAPEEEIDIKPGSVTSMVAGSTVSFYDIVADTNIAKNYIFWASEGTVDNTNRTYTAPSNITEDTIVIFEIHDGYYGSNWGLYGGWLSLTITPQPATITIPKTITMTTKSSDYSINLTGTLSADKIVQITTNPTFELSTIGKPNITAIDITQNAKLPNT
jgi:hypothetical protein